MFKYKFTVNWQQEWLLLWNRQDCLAN